MAQEEGLNGHANGTGGGMDVDTAENVAKYATGGIILPPPEIKAVIDKSAIAIARSANPPQFEGKLRESQRNDPKFSFLNPTDPYHAYYRDRMVKIESGEVEQETAASGVASKPEPEEIQVETTSDETMLVPPPSEYILDLPAPSPLDLDIIKLTALFTARRGRSFLAALSAKEGRNFQFDFLRPTHSLFPYFNQLVDQYTNIINPLPQTIQKISENATPRGKWELLAQSRKYALWEKSRREREQRKMDDKEAEKRAFAEIDWHDYAIVQTIEFTVADMNAELPAPMTRSEVESMTLAQKKMAAMIMEDAEEDIAAHQARQAATDAQNEVQRLSSSISESRDEDDIVARRRREDEERERELQRARAVQASSLDASGPIKIRTDYVPKLGQQSNKALTKCTICGQQIPVDEIGEHMRIELLDPKWKSQRDAIEARRAQASELQRGANVVSSISEFAKARVDIFGDEGAEEKRRQAEEEDRLRRKEREKNVWDGHTATKAGVMDKYSTNVNFEEQIAAIHKAKGIGPVDESAIGPGIGPAIVPPPIAGLPAHPGPMPPPQQATGPGIISSAPQPSSMGMPIQMPPMQLGGPPVALPPIHYQGLGAPQPFGYQPPPPGGMHPSRVAAGNQLAGTVRTADEMTGGEEENGENLAKRQRVQRLPGGHLYPEQNWVDMHPHPITLKVQLPNDNAKPEWKLDGSTIEVADLPVTTLVSTLREKITKPLESSLPHSRMRLMYDGKELRNANTIASYNLEHGDIVVLNIREAKKR